MNEAELVCTELGPEIDRLKSDGFRLDVIYPADDPHTAILSKHGEVVRLTSRPGDAALSDELPAFEPKFVVSHAGAAAGEGRAACCIAT